MSVKTVYCSPDPQSLIRHWSCQLWCFQECNRSSWQEIAVPKWKFMFWKKWSWNYTFSWNAQFSIRCAPVMMVLCFRMIHAAPSQWLWLREITANKRSWTHRTQFVHKSHLLVGWRRWVA